MTSVKHPTPCVTQVDGSGMQVLDATGLGEEELELMTTLAVLTGTRSCVDSAETRLHYCL